ncbi:MAG: D-2-hydroxyacid dehydrogenase family protein [Chloroflexi bacterium]|nr:D-2-hydroxyacid dehydrogenase family protein [Chloroflexota bacterium]
MVKIALLDDYQNVAMKSADWNALPVDCSVEVFQDHLVAEDDLVRRLMDFDVIMAMRERTPFRRSLLQRLPNLKLLSTAGARNASIDMEAATELGILVCGTGGSRGATMELTWGLILSLLRKIPREDRATKSGSWQETVGIGLDGKTIGILGLGRIGSETAEVARAFHMNLIAWSQNLTPERAEECGARLVGKEQLFSEADIITIHLQLSDRTRGLIGAADLARMKPTAFIVNTSRGPIIDEPALIDVLQRKAIAGAGVDVFEPEPLPRDHPILKLDNVVITPHLGYVTEETYEKFYGETIDNVRSFMEGEPARVINTDVLDKRREL